MTSYSKTSIRRFNGHTPTLEHGAYVDPTATVIGRVQLGKDVSVWPQVAIRGDVNEIRIGARSNIQDGSVIHVSRCDESHPQGHSTIIGEDVTVGHKVMLHGCTIGDRVLVGMGAIVLDGAIVDDEVMIGAGALITPGKHLEKGYLYTGSPARRARALSESEIKRFVETAHNYIELKSVYVDELGE
jgi:carbonic anhydrase/acetyltransferase-like protein (isoleucine patch superfamily)